MTPRSIIFVFSILLLSASGYAHAQHNRLVTEKLPPVNETELVQKVVMDIQLRRQARNLINGPAAESNQSPAFHEDAEDGNYIILDSGEKVLYMVYSSILEWQSLDRPEGGTIDLKTHFADATKYTVGEHTQIAPPVIWGAIFLIGGALGTTQCAYLQSECHSGCLYSCPCGASPEFSCAGPEGIASCRCNCVSCEDLDPSNLSWPDPSPVGGYPFVLWDFGSDQPWQLVVGNDDGIGWLTP